MDLAHLVADRFENSIEIITTQRQNPITHRQFDVKKIRDTFPSFQFTSLEDGLKEVHQEEETNLSTRV